MAGSYPDVPGYRFAYDVDGTVVIRYPIGGGAPSQLTTGNLAQINRDQADPGVWTAYNPGDHMKMVWIFPEIRTVLGYFFSVRQVYMPVGGRLLETSANTTDGIDGNWTTVASPYQLNDCETYGVGPYYRSGLQSVNYANVKAVRFGVHQHVSAFHLYGSIAPTESVNRLRVLDVGGSDIAAQLDFGNLQQTAISTKQFKIANNSASLSANNITVSMNTVSDASPTLIGQYQVSTDNISFANAVNIGTLAPGAESSTLYVRMNPASNAQLGPWAARLIAHPTSWS